MIFPKTFNLMLFTFLLFNNVIWSSDNKKKDNSLSTFNDYFTKEEMNHFLKENIIASILDSKQEQITDFTDYFNGKKSWEESIFYNRTVEQVALCLYEYIQKKQSEDFLKKDNIFVLEEKISLKNLERKMQLEDIKKAIIEHKESLENLKVYSAFDQYTDQYRKSEDKLKSIRGLVRMSSEEIYYSKVHDDINQNKSSEGHIFIIPKNGFFEISIYRLLGSESLKNFAKDIFVQQKMSSALFPKTCDNKNIYISSDSPCKCEYGIMPFITVNPTLNQFDNCLNVVKEELSDIQGLNAQPLNSQKINSLIYTLKDN